MEITSVGVVGAGQMGNGIAHVFASAGFDVTMTDISREALDSALDIIRKNLGRQVSRGKISEAEQDAALGRIKTTMALSDLGNQDLIIEEYTKKDGLKQYLDEATGHN